MKKSHLGIVSSIWHQHPDQNPMGVHVRFTRPLASSELPLQRKIVLTTDWTPLDRGWDGPVALVVIENLEGGRFQVQPSEEELVAVMARVIEVAMVPYEGGKMSTIVDISACFLIPPGEAYPFYPRDLSRMCVRCASGKASCHLTIFPG